MASIALRVLAPVPTLELETMFQEGVVAQVAVGRGVLVAVTVKAGSVGKGVGVLVFVRVGECVAVRVREGVRHGTHGVFVAWGVGIEKQLPPDRCVSTVPLNPPAEERPPTV